MTFKALRIPAAAALVAVLAACEAEQTPVGPDFDPNFAVGDLSNGFDDFTPGLARVCAFYPDDAAYGPSEFEASATSGEVYEGTFTLEPLPHCMEVWNAVGDAAADVTGSLVDTAPGLVLDRIVVLASTFGTDPTVTTYLDVNEVTVSLTSLSAANLWFKFEKGDEPPSGGEGCTPGYWRQEHHFDSWTLPYTPETLFGDVFADAFPGQTLLDVVWARGGGLNALGRHTVAALLNTASAGVEYDLTTDQVIAAFNDAYASGDRRIITDQKDGFDFLNNQGCGLN